MSQRKIDLIALETLLHSGFSMAEVARRMGVNKGSISRAAACLRASAKEITIVDAEGNNPSNSLNAKRLQKIMTAIESQLSGIQSAIDISSGEEKRRWLRVQIEHSREVRQQLNLLREISLTLYSIGQIEEFRQTVLSVIGGVDEKIRDEILRRLGKQAASSNLAE
jgi:DNA-binding transcriptional regulator LsrR (DeoR family)